MKNLSPRFLFLFFAVLLSGHALCAHVPAGQLSAARSSNFNIAPGFRTVPIAHFFTGSNSENRLSGLEEPFFENEEDDKLSSLKKYLESSHCVTKLLPALSTGHFSEDLSGFQQHFFSRSSCRYLLLQVFRI